MRRIRPKANSAGITFEADAPGVHGGLTSEIGWHIVSPVKRKIPRQDAPMKNIRSLLFPFLVVLFLACGPAFAHHGAAAYGDKIVVLKEATVTKFIWANPHTIL